MTSNLIGVPMNRRVAVTRYPLIGFMLLLVPILAEAEPLTGMKEIYKVRVTFEDHGKEFFEEDRVQRVVELGLRRNSVPYNPEHSTYVPYIAVKVVVMDIKNVDYYVFGVTVELSSIVQVVETGEYAEVVIWGQSVLGHGGEDFMREYVRKTISEIVDNFSLAYLAANQ